MSSCLVLHNLTYFCRVRAPPTSSKRAARFASPTASRNIKLPPSLAASLAEQPPPPETPLDTDVIEQNAPQHSVFPPRTHLMPEPDTPPPAAGVTDQSSGDAQGRSSNSEVQQACAKVQAMDRVTPPPPVRLSAEEFDAMQAEGAFAGVHERLFRHATCAARVGACLRLLHCVLSAR